MQIQPVLFEDHLVPFFRPLSWTQPLFEIRCGLFNSRERVEILLPDAGGLLLGRGLLAGLNAAAGWTWTDAPAAAVSDADARIVFLNARLCPDGTLLARLVAAARRGPYAWVDEDGLLAAAVDPATGRDLVQHWLEWERTTAGEGGWNRPGVRIGPWRSQRFVESMPCRERIPYGALHGGDIELAQALNGEVRPLRRIWEIVPRTRGAIAQDLELDGDGGGRGRSPFGLFPAPGEPDPVWTIPRRWQTGRVFDQVAVNAPDRFLTGPGVEIAPFVSIDSQAGPVVLDGAVRIESHVHLEGPLYLAPGCRVKAGARLYGETSLGIGCRVAGEIGESTFGDFSNKQHAGFIGHAVLGAWINLGAMTTCSDLKNNYGTIRVDLGDGSLETGLRFVGLLMGDHTKTAIGTLLNTGTCIGPASNVFGGAMPPKWVDSFSWGGQDDSPVYAVEKALETAEVVLGRRGCRLLEAHRELLRALAR